MATSHPQAFSPSNRTCRAVLLHLSACAAWSALWMPDGWTDAPHRGPSICGHGHGHRHRRAMANVRTYVRTTVCVVDILFLSQVNEVHIHCRFSMCTMRSSRDRSARSRRQSANNKGPGPGANNLRRPNTKCQYQGDPRPTPLVRGRRRLLSVGHTRYRARPACTPHPRGRRHRRRWRWEGPFVIIDASEDGRIVRVRNVPGRGRDCE